MSLQLTVGFIVIPRCEMRESEMQCFLDTRALKQEEKPILIVLPNYILVGIRE
jgi:hypothetical protein